jgi:peptidoglycan/xylan/chitin deacetylase (PgdA/CDA1 family)/2-polyprenyl-3-methyl-5-hydroxy-6-metoxy-1,4-benzoquinol methylase
MKVSIIIPAYNAAPTITETLLSLQAQTYHDWEAIVIDDGSGDDTFAIANQFAIQDSRIQVITQLNQGVSAARNFGVKEASSDWVLFLDADDWILPTHLEKLTDALKFDPSLDAVYCGWTRVTPDGKTINYDFSNQASQIFAAFARSCVIAIHSCIVRRHLILDVGGFDPELPTCEEWDLWQRIARTGARFSAIPDALACYRMRANSASFNTRQLLYDGLKVITQGHSPDSRVKNPCAAYAEGMPSQKLSGALLTFVSWVTGLTIGSGDDFLPILAAVENEKEPGLNPEIIALSLFWSAFLPTGQTPSDWYELWLKLEPKINDFLTALEKLSQTPAFAIRVSRRLQSLILEHTTSIKPLTVGTTYAVQQEVTEAFVDIMAPSETERLHCAVTIEGKYLGNVILPICDGFVSNYVLQDAIASQFAWEILGHYFDKTIYSQLTTKRTSTELSIWRGNTYLASMSENETLHNQIGWLVLLQEIWGAHWEQSYFYNPMTTLQRLKAIVKSLQQLNIKSIAENFIPKIQQVQDHITIEISQKLPTLITSSKILEIIPTIAGVALGKISYQVENNKVTPQQLRATILQEVKYELAVAAVREGILGMRLTGNLRERLAKKVSQCQNNCNNSILIGRHPGTIGTSISRRATFPFAAKPDLETTYSFILPTNTSKLSQTIVYVPELIPANLQLEQKHISQQNFQHQPNLRSTFETLFAKNPDPWKYSSAYEQTKYEQTLELLPKVQFEHVLELACAEGHFTVQLAPKVGKLLTTDISQIAIDRTAERCKDLNNISFQRLDFITEPVNGEYDLIICSEVLYYTEKPEVLQAVASKIANAIKPGGYFITAHANLVRDEPNRPGYNWGYSFGAKVIGEAFANTKPLKLMKELRTPLYRIQLFQALPDSTSTIPEIIEIPQPTPPPAKVADTVLWHGGQAQDYWHKEATTTRLPILMYHRVHPQGKPETASWRVTPEAFEQQLKYLQEAGYYSTTLADWGEAILKKQPLPGRAILITFDDGYQDFYNFAFPLLKRYGFSATVFLVADRIGQTNIWDTVYNEELPLMGWDTIKELQSQGIEFGAHTATHPHLTALSPLEIVKESVRARTILQQGLGQTPVTFAYPYGDTDEVVQHLVGACGYIYAVSCKPGLSSFQDPLLALSRVEITGADTLPEFIAKLT